MKDLSKRGLDHKEKLKVWSLWRQGKTLSEIGLTVDRRAGSIFGILKLKCGISPFQIRRRNLYLSREERENIYRGLASALSIRAIARTIARSSSTLSRENSRNGGILVYRAMIEDKKTFEIALRPKCCKLKKRQLSQPIS